MGKWDGGGGGKEKKITMDEESREEKKKHLIQRTKPWAENVKYQQVKPLNRKTFG